MYPASANMPCPDESAPLVLAIKSAFRALVDLRFSRYDLFHHQFIIASLLEIMNSRQFISDAVSAFCLPRLRSDPNCIPA
jgi:hypothetical protein